MSKFKGFYRISRGKFGGLYDEFMTFINDDLAKFQKMRCSTSVIYNTFKQKIKHWNCVEIEMFFPCVAC
jgi:hypothetical protein